MNNFHILLAYYYPEVDWNEKSLNQIEHFLKQHTSLDLDNVNYYDLGARNVDIYTTKQAFLYDYFKDMDISKNELLEMFIDSKNVDNLINRLIMSEFALILENDVIVRLG